MMVMMMPNYTSQLTSLELRSFTRLKNFYQKELKECGDLTLDEQSILSGLVKILRDERSRMGLVDYLKECLKSLRGENVHMRGGMDYQKGIYDAYSLMLKKINR